MSKDYAKHRHEPADAKQPRSLNLLLRRPGLFVAFAVLLGLVGTLYWGLSQHRHHQPLARPHLPAPTLIKVQVSPAKLGVTEPIHSEPTFDFYTVLSTNKAEPLVASVSPSAIITRGAGNQATMTAYGVQVAAFKQQKIASRLAAKLKSLGFKTNVMFNKGTADSWYRVTVGPYRSKFDALEAKKKLAGENLDSIVMLQGKSAPVATAPSKTAAHQA